jgi:hypothetical protein
MRLSAPLGGLIVLAMPALACGSPASPSADSIVEIRQERDCSGCDSGTAVTLRRDGTATFVRTGKARFGTTDRTSTGSVSAADFERLAALVVANGFYAMQDEYRDPNLADGAWVTTSAAGERAKTVVDSNEAGPAKLREIEDAIEAMRAAITWTPAQ